MSLDLICTSKTLVLFGGVTVLRFFLKLRFLQQGKVQCPSANLAVALTVPVAFLLFHDGEPHG